MWQLQNELSNQQKYTSAQIFKNNKHRDFIMLKIIFEPDLQLWLCQLVPACLFLLLNQCII